MAQRTIHYLFGDMISKHVEIQDKARFLFGMILPDAFDAGERDKSHFKIRTDTHSYFDFEAFRKKYLNRMLQDDLYLGYYMHLVEDAFYRAFIYEDRFVMPRTQDEVIILHNDYHLLNAYIVKKYNIHNILEKEFDLKKEPISEITNFHTKECIAGLLQEFVEQPTGTTRFLTENMLDEFVEKYIQLAIDEVRNIKTGNSILEVMDYAWLRKR